MGPLPPSRTVQVTGITIHLVEQLKHSLYIKLTSTGHQAQNVVFKREKGQIGNRTHSFSGPLSLREGSTLTIRIERKHQWIPTPKTIARLELPFETVWLKLDLSVSPNHFHALSILNDGKKELWLNINASPPTPRPSPTLHPPENPPDSPGNLLSVLPSTPRPRMSRTDLTQGSHFMTPPPSPRQAVESLEDTSNALIQQLKAFMTTLDHLYGIIYRLPVDTFESAISELKPTANTVQSYVNTFYEQINARDQGHEEILALVKCMATTVDHIQSVKDVAELNELKMTLELFLDLMEETANLFLTWVEQSVLASNSLLPFDKNKMDDLQKRYTSFRTEFDRYIMLDQNRSLDKFHGLQELYHHLLKNITTIEPRANECIPGTRVKILGAIASETDNHDNTNVVWIRGAPGSGKSSISLTIKSQLRSEGRLVTYFRFDRKEATTTTTTALWRHVAYDLARRLPSVRRRVLRKIRGDEVDLSSPMAVFSTLVEESLLKSTEAPPEQPLIIVIDAMDECGGFAGTSSTDRRALLQTVGRWPKLPSYFKLLVTSREDGDIIRVLSGISIPIEIRSGHFLTEKPQDEASVHASNDIRTFLEDRFRLVRERIPGLPRDWPQRDAIDGMVHRAAGIFMWATAAAGFIDCAGADPQDRLDKIMSHSPEFCSMKPLYSLYTAILETSFGGIAHDDSEAETLLSVLGIIVLAKRPLDDIEYTKLPTSKPVTKALLNSIRDGLRSVVSPGVKLRFSHRSFDDFLLSEECPSKYRIKIDFSQFLLTELCLTTMTEKLHFNMCNLKTSCLKNVDVPEFETTIPPLLSYSCSFWADHLHLTPFDGQLMLDVKTMILDKLMYWFEAMSLLGEVNRVPHSLLLVLQWSTPSPDDPFKDFIHDARRFIGAFGQPIAQSAPHVYISALPFAPEHSSVARHFLPRFPNILTLTTGKPTDWPICIFTSEHHNAEARSVAFSPDEKHFVSGSGDKTLCICDAETGIRISGQFGDNSRVLRVSFDPKGKRVWASCGDDNVVGNIIGWNVETGDKYIGFPAGTTMDSVFCCCFDDGRNIVSASKRQGIVTLWNADTGKRLHDLLTNVMVYTVSFSPDGRYMACAGFGDTVIKIWKLAAAPSETRELSQSPPQFKHTTPISTLAFSADGKFVVSGSCDGSILVWDVETGDTVGRPLVTDMGRLDAIAYSPKSNLIVSASSSANGVFGTVMVWDAFTHKAVLGPLDGHELWITEIVLSRDGQRALSASWDRTVRMWDLGRTRAVPVTHADRGQISICVVFSPREEKLASLGQDRAIRIWDPNTGELFLEPIDGVSDYTKIIFSPDGSKILAYGSTDGTVQAWSADTGSLVFRQDLSDDNQRCTQIERLAFQGDGRLITCSSNGVLRICSLENGSMTERFPALPLGDAVKIIALSPDGLTAIVRDDNREPHHSIWNIEELDPLPLTFDDDEYLSGHRVVYSPSGKFFAASYNLQTDGASLLRVWNVQTGKLVLPPSELNNVIDCLAFSPDNRRIAFSYVHSPDSGTAAIYTWEVKSGEPVSGPWMGHTDSITRLAFSSDGEKLVSGSRDGQIRIWNTHHLFGKTRASDTLLGVGTHMQDGWVMDAQGNLLFWVPKDHRTKLVWPGNLRVIGRSGITTELDLARFRHGEEWAECLRVKNG